MVDLLEKTESSAQYMVDLVSSRVGRAFGSEAAYSDALSSVNKFNARLLRERRTRLRLPFVDSQTHIIQMPSQHYLWRQPTQRLMPARTDQVSHYPRRPWYKKRPNPPTNSSNQQQTSMINSANGPTDVSMMDTSNKSSAINGTTSQQLTEDDPRILMRAGDLGMSENDLQSITTVENPGNNGSRFSNNTNDESSQSSLSTPITGLVQPQQPHWPQHNVTHNHHHLHPSSYLLDVDDDPDDLDYDEYTGGSGPGTPAGPSSPVSSYGRPKRGAPTKRNSQTTAKSKNNSSTPPSTGGSHSTTPPTTGNRRQQYSLAELPFACDFCPARYKTKPGLQYHLTKHKESNTDYRPSPPTPSTADSTGSSSSPSAMSSQVNMMKQKYMTPPIDHHHHQQQQQQQQGGGGAPMPSHPMYPNHPGHPMQNPPGSHMGPPGYPMNHPQGHPYSGMPMGQHPHGYPQQQQQPLPPQQHGMGPSATMPLTTAALSGSVPPPGGMPYYSQQHHPMMHQHQQQQQQQQHMMMHPQSHPHHQGSSGLHAGVPSSSLPPPLPPNTLQNKSQTSNVDPNVGITPGLQCDFCGGDEQENKTTKLPEQMITCKDCGGSAHPTCLKFTPNMVRQVKTYPWQCMECKTCTECGNSENDSELLFCDDCDRGYHMYCCSPPLAKAPDGDWRCKLCCAQFGELSS